MIFINDYVMTIHRNATTGEQFFLVSRKSDPTDQGEMFETLDDALEDLIAKYRARLLQKSAELSAEIKRDGHAILRMTVTTKQQKQV